VGIPTITFAICFLPSPAYLFFVFSDMRPLRAAQLIGKRAMNLVAPRRMGGSYYFLDLTALGRQKDWEEPKDRVPDAHDAVPNFS
jgi:hypothetical protein